KAHLICTHHKNDPWSPASTRLTHLSIDSCNLMNHQPRGVPLLPYTTLFRSRHQSPQFVATSRQTRSECADSHAQHACAVRVTGVDRKSTRLNSSHVSISYAVFCLRKKERQLKKPDRCTPARSVIVQESGGSA